MYPGYRACYASAHTCTRFVTRIWLSVIAPAAHAPAHGTVPLLLAIVPLVVKGNSILSSITCQVCDLITLHLLKSPRTITLATPPTKHTTNHDMNTRNFLTSYLLFSTFSLCSGTTFGFSMMPVSVGIESVALVHLSLLFVLFVLLLSTSYYFCFLHPFFLLFPSFLCFSSCGLPS